MSPAFVRFAVLAGSVLLLSIPARAQERVALGDSPSVAAPRDSASVLADARSAQAAFERSRFLLLPRTHETRSGRCDERIGRICFWFSEDENGDDPPPEPPAIAGRRARLNETLAQAVQALPGDEWIVGQRVRYLLESKDVDGALATARACAAARWWCAALRGLALHNAGELVPAEQAFDTALATMDAERRERWMDLSVLLRPEDRRAWRGMSGPERVRLARRVWWLADPLWSHPGNDRLTEHYARWTMDHIQRDARQVDHLQWAGDLGEVLVRYGWFTAWERYEPIFYASAQSAHAVGYNEPRSWEFIPPLRAARDPMLLRGDEWPLSETTPTATRHTPPYARHVMALPHQLAVFPRRGGGALLVAGYALPEDSLPADPRLRAALVAMDDDGGRRAESPWQPTAASGALYVELSGPGAIVSLELREDSTRTIARRRQAVAVDADARVSDLLLLAHPEARPTEVMEAARIARGSAIVAPGERVGVFWEMYDVEASDSVQVRVGLVPAQAEWGRRRLEAIGIVKGARTMRMGWNEGVEAGPVVGRSLAVGIPPDLRPGEYTLEVTVITPGAEPATARRQIIVRRESRE